MNFFNNRAVIVHGNKLVFLNKRIKLESAEEIADREQLYQNRKVEVRLNKAGDLRGLSQGSRSGDGNKASGKFTAGVRRSLQRCIDIFFMRAPEVGGINPATGRRETLKAAMHTLTIPGGARLLKASEFKKELLSPYIKTLAEQFGVQAYVYGCEFHTEGENRGQMHVHLFVDRYIPKKACKERWWSLLDKAGLSADYYRRGKTDKEQGCFVQGIKTNSNLQFYLQKYLVKSRQKEGTTTGHWWGASSWIKKSPLPTFEPSEQTDMNIYDNRGKPEFYYNDVYMHKDTKELLFNEAGAATPGAKKMMTIVRGNFNKEKGIRQDVKVLLSAKDRQLYQAFITAYRRCDWEWCQMAAVDLPQLMRQVSLPIDYTWLYDQFKSRAAVDREARLTAWEKYKRDVKAQVRSARRPEDNQPELRL